MSKYWCVQQVGTYTIRTRVSDRAPYLLDSEMALPSCFCKERHGKRSDRQNHAGPSQRRAPFLDRQAHNERHQACRQVYYRRK